MEYRKTHNPVGLIQPLEEHGFKVSEELKRKAYFISGWEASGRYADDFSVVKEEIEDAIKLYEQLEKDILKRIEG